MATIQTDARMQAPAPRNTKRRNEIIAIALLALSLLLALCLASYDPNDSSWNAAGHSDTQNLAGAIGASVAAALLQLVGLVAYVIPLLLLIAASGRLRPRQIAAPIAQRAGGGVLLVLAVPALLALSTARSFVDHSFQSGGFIGALVSHVLANGFSRVGAGVLLLAATAAGLLLVTNFSYAHAYQHIFQFVSQRFAFVSLIPRSLKTWLAERRSGVQESAEKRRVEREQCEQARVADKKFRGKTGAERVAEFMRETTPAPPANASAATAIKRAAFVVVDTDEEAASSTAERSMKRTSASVTNDTRNDDRSLVAAQPPTAPAPPATVQRDKTPERDARTLVIAASESRVAAASATAATGGGTPPVPSATPAVFAGSRSPSASPTSSSRAATTVSPPASLPPRPTPAEDTEIEKDAGEVAEMVRSAAVVRPEAAATTSDVTGTVTDTVTGTVTGEVAATAATRSDSAPQQRASAASPTAERTSAKKATSSFSEYQLPDLNFLNTAPPRREQADEELLGLAARLAEKCREFNVTGQIKHICPGPVVTTYEFKPDPGVKYSRVTGLVDDLCLALKAESIRIDRLPGKPHVGIEVPNPQRETIYLREVLESRPYRESTSKLTLALGKTIDGLNYVADLAKMPHLLIAGATGTGKSVCLNSLIVSILYKASPDEVKFIMVDPKRLELGLYANIPHLSTPIITDPKRAANALKWAVAHMEQRYKDLAGWGVRGLDSYNAEVMRRNMAEDFGENGEPWKPLPYLIIIIDELADLMMVSGHEVEEAITRLAQMARAVGIHLVLATQRPSVDVITGLIKANFPSRISFRVSSKVDSRTILDANGAEQLLGRGDMLFLPPGTSRLVRVHGAYLEESEVYRIVAHAAAQGAAVYDETITQSTDEAAGADAANSERDELFDSALRICVEMKRASTSVLQRRLRIGYGRAAAILDVMEREGYIGPSDGARPRPMLGRSFETIAHWDDIEIDDPE